MSSYRNGMQDGADTLGSLKPRLSFARNAGNACAE
jgi:hypothetical protein